MYVALLCLLCLEGGLALANKGLTNNGGQGMFLLAAWKVADGAQAQGWQEEDGTWRVELTGAFNISFKAGNEFE